MLTNFGFDYFDNFDNHVNKDNHRDLWHLRHWLQYWQLRTWIHDNLCYLTLNCDTGQHSQFLRCFDNSFVSVGYCSQPLMLKMYSWTIHVCRLWMYNCITCLVSRLGQNTPELLIRHSAQCTGYSAQCTCKTLLHKNLAKPPIQKITCLYSRHGQKTLELHIRPSAHCTCKILLHKRGKTCKTTDTENLWGLIMLSLVCNWHVVT